MITLMLFILVGNTQAQFNNDPYNRAGAFHNVQGADYSQGLQRVPEPTYIIPGNPVGAENSGFTIQQGNNYTRCITNSDGVTVCQ